MADNNTRAWVAVLTKGSASLKKKLTAKHGDKPEFQRLLKSTGQDKETWYKMHQKKQAKLRGEDPASKEKERKKIGLKAWGATKGTRLGGDEGGGFAIDAPKAGKSVEGQPRGAGQVKTLSVAEYLAQKAKEEKEREEAMKKKSMKEESEINEKNDTWNPDPTIDANLGGRSAAIVQKKITPEKNKKKDNKHLTLLKQLAAAGKRIAAEEVEQVDELNKSTLRSYRGKAKGELVFGNKYPFFGKKATKRREGIAKATKKIGDEKTYQVDEGLVKKVNKNRKRLVMGMKGREKLGPVSKNLTWQQNVAQAVKAGRTMNESEDVQHLVKVTVSDPSVKSADRMLKSARVRAASEEEAIKKVKSHYRKAGFKVHDAYYHSKLTFKNKVDEAAKWRKSSAAEPDEDASVERHYETGGKSTGALKVKGIKKGDTGGMYDHSALENRRKAQITKGKTTKASNASLKARIRANLQKEEAEQMEEGARGDYLRKLKNRFRGVESSLKKMSGGPTKTQKTMRTLTRAVSKMSDADVASGLKKFQKEEAVTQESYQGKGNNRPGWMLRADPELAKKIKEKRRMNDLMSKYGGKIVKDGKIVKEAKLDKVGRETADIDNDKDVDKTDMYLHNRRKKIGAALAKKKLQEGKAADLADKAIAMKRGKGNKINRKPTMEVDMKSNPNIEPTHSDEDNSANVKV